VLPVALGPLDALLEVAQLLLGARQAGGALGVLLLREGGALDVELELAPLEGVV